MVNNNFDYLLCSDLKLFSANVERTSEYSTAKY